MAIKNTASNHFRSTFVDIIYVFDCRLPGVYMCADNIRSIYLLLSDRLAKYIFINILCQKKTPHIKHTLFMGGGVFHQSLANDV